MTEKTNSIKSKKAKGKSKAGILIIIGIMLIIAGLGLTLYNFVTDYKAYLAVKSINAKMEFGNEGQFIIDADMEMPTVTIDGYDYIGELEIPSVKLKLPVISHWDYNTLTFSPGRYVGSVYKDNMVIAAHNYQSHFGKLFNINTDDEVTFTDVDGHKFIYKVIDVEIIQPEDIDGMTAGNWDLTLFTCTYGGLTRWTVRCDRINNDFIFE